MKFRIVTALVIAAALAPAVNVQAATVGQSFTVNTTFTPACITNSTGNAINFGAYTAFGSAANTAPSTTITFQCSRAFTIVSAVFDTAPNLASIGGTDANPTAGGGVAGLQYTLATAAAVKTTTGTVASATTLGTGDVYSYVVTGAMPGGQAGCVSSGNSGDSCTATQTRTLTVSY